MEGREPEENVMPIVPPGNALDDMILESGDRFFETSRAMENCLFEVNCIMGRRTIDIILFVGIIVCLIITAYTGYAAIEKLKGGGNELTAGICEEIVFRGFLLYLLGKIFLELSPFFWAVHFLFDISAAFLCEDKYEV